MNIEDHQFPIYIETDWQAIDQRRFGKIIAVNPRTRCTRKYIVTFENDETVCFKGAASRPRWIKTIFRSKEAYADAVNKALPTCPLMKQKTITSKETLN